MLIRCSRCKALYSVQDTVAPGGLAFAVECGRCRQVFQAEPSRRATSAPPVSAPSPPLASAPPASPAETPTPPAKPALLLIRTTPPPPPEETPEPAPEGPEAADPFLEASKRARRKLAAFAGVGLALLGLLIWWIAASGVPRAAREKMAEGEQKLFRDDQASLVGAAQLFEQARQAAPRTARPEAERGFALLLQAAADSDQANRLERRARELAEQVVKAQAAQDYSKAGRLNAEIAQLGSEREGHIREAAKLLETGVAAAKQALEEDPDEGWGLRAMALYCGLTHAPDRGRRYLAQAEERSSTPWDPLVHAILGDDPANRLAQALAAERRMLRARVELAGILADKGQPVAAREQLNEVVKANPEHARAKRMLALLP